jgi:hypothetical protein
MSADHRRPPVNLTAVATGDSRISISVQDALNSTASPILGPTCSRIWFFHDSTVIWLLSIFLERGGQAAASDVPSGRVSSTMTLIDKGAADQLNQCARSSTVSTKPKRPTKTFRRAV